MENTSNNNNNDPFGLSRRRRISTTLEPYLSPQRKGARLTVETVDNTEASPSNSPPFISTPTTPWSNDMVSKISPQDTVSPLELPRRMSLDTSVQSQSMRKQLLQLVTSLQLNLKESQDVRQEQQLQLQTQADELKSLREELDQQQQEHERVETRAERQHEERERAWKQREEFLEQQLQLVKQTHDEEGLRLQQSDEERQRAYKVEVKEFCAERDKHEHFLETKQEELQRFQHSLEKESQALSRERTQLHALQQQLLTLQTTQLDLESTHQEEEERLLQAAEELDRKQRDLVERDKKFQQEHEEKKRELKKQQEELYSWEHSWEGKLQEQERKLQTWQRSLETQQAQLDEKETQVESSLARKVQDMAKLEAQLHSQQEELLQRQESQESRLLLQEQALQELVEQRQEEEERLDNATRHLEQATLQSKKIRMDAKKVKEALQGKMARSHVEYENLQKDIQEKQVELEEYKKRLSLFVLEDRKSRTVAEETLKKLQSDLDHVQGQLQEARSTHEQVERDIAGKQKEHDCLVLQVRQEQELWETRRKELELELKTLHQAAKDDVLQLDRECSQRREAASRELEERMEDCERMRADLETQAKRVGETKERLLQEQDECASERLRLDRLLALMDSTAEQDKKQRADMEWELERLQSLLETERRSHEQHVRSESQQQTSVLECLRQEHREELQSLANRIETLEAECFQLERDCKDARDTVAEQEKQHSLEVNTLVGEKKHTEEELASALKRADTLETTVKRLTTDQVESRLQETEERGKIRLLMERLEVNGTKLENKLKAVELDEKLIEEQKEQVREQLEASKKAGEEFQERLCELREKERVLKEKESNVGQRESELEQKSLDLCRERQREAMRSLVTKSWRQDQEAVSAAFSKWVRVAMVYDDETEGASVRKRELEESQRLLEQGRQEMDEIRKRLEAQEEQLVRKEKRMEAEQKDIKAQHDALHSAEAKLSGDLADLARQKESFEVECNEKKKRLHEERAKLDKDRATLAQLDKYLAAKEKKLAHVNDASSTATESTRHVSRSIETSLHDERKWIDKAAAAITEREDELERKESALRQSQASIRAQEERLAAELADCQQAQARVRSMAEHVQKREALLEQKEQRIAAELTESQFFARVRTMAEQLQRKDEQLAAEKKLLQDRFQECDECERQLRKWQQELDSTAAMRIQREQQS